MRAVGCRRATGGSNRGYSGDVTEANDATDLSRHLLYNVIEVAALAENSVRRRIITIASASPVQPFESADEVCIR